MSEVTMPRLSDTMTEGTISRWLKHEGDTIKTGDVLAEIETDKAIMELEAYEGGPLTHILVPEGQTVPIGTVIATIGDSSVSTKTLPSPSHDETVISAPTSQQLPRERDSSSERESSSQHSSTIRATPLVRHLAREHHINLDQITGTGPAGRIVRADIDAYLARQESISSVMPNTALVVNDDNHDELIPLNPIRRVTAQRLTQSAGIPHFHLMVSANVDKLLTLREQLNTQLLADNPTGHKISITDLLIRACAVTLTHHRQLNSSWDNDHLIQHAHINIGCAVAIETGLVVPVIDNADTKTLTQISATTHDLIDRARRNRLSPQEMTGSTFTISNLGGYGIDSFIAVINPPEAAILAVGAITERAIIQQGQPVAAHMLDMTLTVDHRVLDGAVAAAFLQDLVKTLQYPLRIIA